MRRAAQVGAVLRGTVSSVKPYGLFVRLEGFRANALVHLSQVRPPPPLLSMAAPTGGKTCRSKAVRVCLL